MWRVRQQKIRYGEVTWHTYGPYRWRLQAEIVALLTVKEYDAAFIEHKS